MHAPPVHRPPWALAEPHFLDACTRCGDCVRQCPQQVLVVGAGGYPEFDPARGECTFCGTCAGVCASKALDRAEATPPWSLRAQVRREACLAAQGIVCASCQDACPERAIRFDPPVGARRTPMVDAAACTGCGACVGACPVTAVSLAAEATP